MDQQIDAAWKSALHDQQPFALLMLDIDNFKKYNDHYGHQSGDDCLRSVAKSIEAVTETANSKGLTLGAFAARYGGEEFAVTIPRATKEAFEEVAHSIVQAVRDLAIPHEKNNAWGITTISIGGARQEAATGALSQLFRKADENLYKAKDAGRNRAAI
jgi:diguanylate cyclase (GGDEF)-like protein